MDITTGWKASMINRVVLDQSRSLQKKKTSSDNISQKNY